MWKVLIADDEPNIRYGLISLLERDVLDIQIVGEAENGLDALKLISETQPDILLVDICMPHLNGLQLIDQVKDVLLKECKIIIITGHDEFGYAQQALKLKVFDYILKPVSRLNLLEIIEKAKAELSELNSTNKYYNWADLQLKKNMPYLRGKFLNDFLNDKLTNIELEEQIEFFELDIRYSQGMIITRIEEKYNIGEQKNQWDRYLLLFAVQNIIEEMLSGCKPNTIFRDEKEDIIAILPIRSVTEWVDIKSKIEANIKLYLKQTVQVCSEEFKNGLLEIPSVYNKLSIEINNQGNSLPVISLVKKYIDENYYKMDLSLQEVAQFIIISPNYLSRLLKQAEGHSFTEFLTMVRVNKATKLMDNPNLKVYEIAEKVGYKTQHYFCTAFKKVLGVSPTEYRKMGDES